MAMRPEDIEALLAQMQQGGGNPLANAIGKFSGQQPGLGGQMMGPGATPQGMPPQRMPVGGTPRPEPLPPSVAPSMSPVSNQPAMDNEPDADSDEAMLSQVQQGMGENGGDDDMQADADDLVAMYENGDSSDPQTLEQWRAAKDAFIAKYGEENLPSLPNDPDTGGTERDY